MKKKKEKILIVLIILIILVIPFIIKIILSNKKHITEKRIKELLYENYVYYELSSGNIKTNDSILKLDDETFYSTNINISSLDELNTLIKDMVVKERQNIFIDNIYENNVIYTVELNTLYVNKSNLNPNCDINKISYQNDYKLIKKNRNYYKLQYSANDVIVSEVGLVKEDGKWKLESALTFCEV